MKRSSQRRAKRWALQELARRIDQRITAGINRDT
jgi:hypothetical protein